MLHKHLNQFPGSLFRVKFMKLRLLNNQFLSVKVCLEDPPLGFP